MGGGWLVEVGGIKNTYLFCIGKGSFYGTGIYIVRKTPDASNISYFNLCRVLRNLFLPYANNKGADQPAHSHSLISTFIVCYLHSIIPSLAKTEISRF